MQKLKREDIPKNADTDPDIVDDLNQTFCSRCAGLKKMTYKGKLVDPFDWFRFGMASDIGCIC